MVAQDDQGSTSTLSLPLLESSPADKTVSGVGGINTSCDDIEQISDNGIVPQEGGQGTILSSSFNLFTTMVGGGIMAVPHSIQSAGLAVGVSSLCFICLVGFTSLYVLFHVADVTGKRSYQTLVEHFYGRRGLGCIEVAIVVLLFGAIIMFIYVSTDMLLPFCPSGMPRELFTIVVVVLTAPPCLLSTLHSLRHLSIVVTGGIAFIVFATCYRWGESGVRDDVQYVGTPMGVAMAIPIHGLSFACHINCVRVYDELKVELRPKAHHVLLLTLGTALAVYMLFGLAGYLQFGEDTLGDVMVNFPSNDALITTGRAILGICVILKTPLIIQPLRGVMVSNLMKIPACAHVNHDTLFWRAVNSSVILVLAYFCAICIPSLTHLMDILGATGGVLIGYIVPGLLMYMTAKHALVSGPLGLRNKLVGAFLVCFGCLVCATALYSTVVKWDAMPSETHAPVEPVG
eukprot:GFYU01006586.1.p1 GENE.GFYU01006586.1~~GFYU01006586.1.p1  ORF type:complete len:459 (-),score=93.84 GFYU01006586.1:225-1601(-)